MCHLKGPNCPCKEKSQVTRLSEGAQVSCQPVQELLFNWKCVLFCFAGSTVLLDASGHSAQTQTPPRKAAFGIKWACLSPQTAANVRAWENNELFQEIYLFSFLTPKLILRNEICVCFSLGMFEFTSPKSWGTRSGRHCLRLHMRWINLLFTSLPTSFQKRRELTTTKNH